MGKEVESSRAARVPAGPAGEVETFSGEKRMNYGFKGSEVQKDKCAPGVGSRPETFMCIEKKKR